MRIHGDSSSPPNDIFLQVFDFTLYFLYQAALLELELYYKLICLQIRICYPFYSDKTNDKGSQCYTKLYGQVFPEINTRLNKCVFWRGGQNMFHISHKNSQKNNFFFTYPHYNLSSLQTRGGKFPLVFMNRLQDFTNCWGLTRAA